MKKITKAELVRFAKKVAGQRFRTLRRRGGFVVDVVDGKIVSIPDSGIVFWMEVDDYVRHFNRHNSLRPGAYPKKLWSNSYFVALADAMVNGTKPVTHVDTPTVDGAKLPPSPELEAKVRSLRSQKALPAPSGQESPKWIEVTIRQALRDPAVKAWVLKASAGKCNYCLKLAPFKDDDGKPFLEVHHVKHLVDGGADTIANTVALCPNCHRAFHFAQNRKRMVPILYKRYARLKVF